MKIDRIHARGNPCRVVIVDDSRSTRATLEQTLSKLLGFEIVGVASDAASASQMIRDLCPDLVTIDLRMLYIDGRQLLEAISDLRGIRKVVVSSQASSRLEMRACLEGLGADACIDKAELSSDPAAFCRKIQLVASRPKASQPTSLARSGDGSRTRSIGGAGSTGSYPVPSDEFRRVRLLDELHLANDDADHRLDLLTTHLAQTTSFSSSVMMFVHRRATWIKSGHGMARGRLERAEAICSHTICHDEPLIVPDALQDPRFRDLAVVRSGEVRAYVGCPIVASSGVRIGALCLLDNRPRQVSPADLANLCSITRIATEFVEMVPDRVALVA